MVNGPVTAREAERALAIGYAPAAARPALAALLALDDAMAGVLRSTRQPVVGQMRLAWWRERLAALDAGPPPAEPVLAAVARLVLPLGAAGVRLAALADGWEALLADPLDAAALAQHGTRGAVLFAAAARVLGAAVPTEAAGRGWALADAARHLSDDGVASSARAQAADALAGAPRYWPNRARPLGALTALARSDLAGGIPGAPGRVARLAWLKLSGR